MVSALRVESLPPAVEVAPGPPAPRFPLLRAVAGVAGLGLAGGLAGQTSALASAPAGLLAGAGVLCLTTPALVVAQQYLRLHATPSAVVGAVWEAFTRAGLVALGVVPAVAWLAATSDLGPGFASLLFAAIGAFAALLAIEGLGRAEQKAGGSFAAGTGLGILWAGLASLVGLRLLFLFSA